MDCGTSFNISMNNIFSAHNLLKFRIKYVEFRVVIFQCLTIAHIIVNVQNVNNKGFWNI